MFEKFTIQCLIILTKNKITKHTLFICTGVKFKAILLLLCKYFMCFISDEMPLFTLWVGTV